MDDQIRKADVLQQTTVALQPRFVVKLPVKSLMVSFITL